MFGRWECGCVGITEGDGIVIDACDTDRDAPAESLCWQRRDMRDKAYRPLSDADAQALHARIARRFAAADRFDTAVTALGVTAVGGRR